MQEVEHKQLSDQYLKEESKILYEIVHRRMGKKVDNPPPGVRVQESFCQL